MRKYLLFVALPLLLAACQSAGTTLEGFDAYVWKRDKLGCGNARSQMIDTLMAQRDKLLQLTENELIGVLGKPDARSLYERSQKFIIYLLEPNAKCTAAENAPVKAKALHIRLNAIGRANEVFIDAF